MLPLIDTFSLSVKWNFSFSLSFRILKSLFALFIVREKGRNNLLEAMAVGMAIVSHGGEYNGRIASFVVLSCMIAVTGGVIFSYDIGISVLSPDIPSFQISYHVNNPQLYVYRYLEFDMISFT